MSDDSTELIFATMPVLFHRHADKHPTTISKPRLISASGRVIGRAKGTKKPRVCPTESFRLTPREIRMAQIVAARLVADELSDCPGLAFAIGLEADRLRSERRCLCSAPKRQTFIKAVIEEIGARTKQRDSLSIYIDRAVDKITKRCSIEESQKETSRREELQQVRERTATATVSPAPSSSSSDSSESGCSFRIVKYVPDTQR